MTTNNIEYRSLPAAELRTTETEGRRVIEGHAAVFSRWSETLGGFFPFKEKVRAGAFKRSIETDDIRALWNHNSDHVLGRNKAGTLELKEDEKGLFVRVYPPDAQWARDLQTSIARGDISSMSFGFTVEKDEWSTDENGTDTRELISVKLFDVSPVTFPAYKDTDASTRSYEAYKAARSGESERSARESADKRAAERARLEQIRRRLELLKTRN
jgi:HK97 family phage prohead protease